MRSTEIEFQNSVILNLAIGYYLSYGYRVKSQTKISAEMVRPKQFAILLADETLSLRVDNTGQLTITDQNRKVRVVKKGQPIARAGIHRRHGGYRP